MMALLRIAVLGAAAVLASCSPGNSTAAYQEHVPQWQKLEDGSSFARLTILNGRNELAVRCWPDAGAGFRCLRVGRFSDLGSVNVAIEDAPELPTFDVGTASTSDGYSCGYVLGYRETISRSGQDLVSNQIDYGQTRWSKAFVERYMKSNGVGGQHYYGCLSIAEAVVKGSLETVSTTSITRAMIY